MYKSVRTTHRQYDANADPWAKCRDCYDGEDAVKAKTEKYLPMLEGQRLDALNGRKSYDSYLLRATFFNGMGRTVDGLAGLAVQKTPTITASAELTEAAKDITLTGVPLEMLILDVTKEVFKVGRCGVLVDMPPETEGPVAPNVVALPARPYFTVYRSEQIINWRTERYEGHQVLTRLVLLETFEEPDPDDEFAVEVRQRCRVLELVNGAYVQAVWVQDREDRDKWVATERFEPKRRGVPLPYIPFVFSNPDGVSPDVSKPPLVDVANVNLSHFRTMADLEWGRLYVALPTPWLSGAVIDDKTGPLVLGSSKAWVLSENGRVGMLEFSGAGLAALVTAEQDKRKMMAVLGARMLEDQAVAPGTATEFVGKHAGENSNARSIIQSVEQAITIALRWFDWWWGALDIPQSSTAAVELDKSFLNQKLTIADLTGLMALWQGGAISIETLYYNLVRGEVTRPGVEFEEEKQQLDAEAEEAAKRAAEQAEQFGLPNPVTDEPPDTDEDEDEDEKE